LNWLVESEVISDADCEAFERLKAMRNKLAHELPSCVLGGADFQFASHFQEASDLLEKIEVWWILNVEIPTNPDYDGEEIDTDGIIPGPVLMLQLMLDVVNGNDEYLQHYRNASVGTKP